MSADAYHMTAPLEDGSGGSKSAQCGDQECRHQPGAGQLRQRARHLDAAGRRRGSGRASSAPSARTHVEGLVVNSTKSMTGHLLGGAGGLEAVFTVLALHHQVVAADHQPGQPGPGLRSGFLRQHRAHMQIDYALKNSFGFGGTNGSLVFGKV
jgi:3-oxoacyl-[acyl-carrier-protein] synthase II